jgi:hypothetical protein
MSRYTLHELQKFIYLFLILKSPRSSLDLQWLYGRCLEDQPETTKFYRLLKKKNLYSIYGMELHYIGAALGERPLVIYLIHPLQDETLKPSKS